MGGIGLWGHARNLDYWTALARGEVPAAEQRAVALLKRVVDPYRFSLYCVRGRLPCMGNVTGTIYAVQKGGGVVELDDDGAHHASWCISIGPHCHDVPDTDHVVALRAVIEGEELAFLRTGNRGVGYGLVRNVGEHPEVCNPFEEGFLDGADVEDDEIGTAELLEIDPGQEETVGPVVRAIGDYQQLGEDALGDDIHGEYVQNPHGAGGYIQVPRRGHRRRRYRRDNPEWFQDACLDAGQELGEEVGRAARVANDNAGVVFAGGCGVQYVGPNPYHIMA
jgi:hypothetical protein